MDNVRIAQYAYNDGDLQGLVPEIIWNDEIINIGIVHNNGVFLIEEEGYYRITVNLRSRPDEVHLHAIILKDNVDVLAFCDTDNWQTTSMNTIVHMEKYNMFKIRIKQGKLNGGPSMEASTQNLIQVEKIFWNRNF